MNRTTKRLYPTEDELRQLHEFNVAEAARRAVQRRKRDLELIEEYDHSPEPRRPTGRD